MDSPAFVSGLQSGDVIVAVNNTEVSNVSAYNTQLMKQKPEDTCNLESKEKRKQRLHGDYLSGENRSDELAEIRRIYEVYFNSPRGRENQ